MPEQLENISNRALEVLTLKHAARERVLPKSRTAIRFCANSIRATHRHEFERASELMRHAAVLLRENDGDLQEHLDIYFAGFILDAQKEFAEAKTFAALVQHALLPTPEEISVGYAAYLNGLAEAVGELRRYVLDLLRHGNIEECERYLASMDDIYAVLITIDFPDAVTAGLRRTTDATRGILEKTRGDLTTAVIQTHLQHSMLDLQKGLQKLDRS
jgi:translin